MVIIIRLIKPFFILVYKYKIEIFIFLLSILFHCIFQIKSTAILLAPIMPNHNITTIILLTIGNELFLFCLLLFGLVYFYRFYKNKQNRKILPCIAYLIFSFINYLIGLCCSFYFYLLTEANFIQYLYRNDITLAVQIILTGLIIIFLILLYIICYYKLNYYFPKFLLLISLFFWFVLIHHFFIIFSILIFNSHYLLSYIHFFCYKYLLKKELLTINVVNLITIQQLIDFIFSYYNTNLFTHVPVKWFWNTITEKFIISTGTTVSEIIVLIDFICRNMHMLVQKGLLSESIINLITIEKLYQTYSAFYSTSLHTFVPEKWWWHFISTAILEGTGDSVAHISARAQFLWGGIEVLVQKGLLSESIINLITLDQLTHLYSDYYDTVICHFLPEKWFWIKVTEEILAGRNPNVTRLCNLYFKR